MQKVCKSSELSRRFECELYVLRVIVRDDVDVDPGRVLSQLALKPFLEWGLAVEPMGLCIDEALGEKDIVRPVRQRHHFEIEAAVLCPCPSRLNRGFLEEDIPLSGSSGKIAN
jgi:hypothetical protein